MSYGFSQQYGWSVGLFDWLDSASSKVNRYWRAIELGSSWWDGRIMAGLWGSSAGTNARPNTLIFGQSLTPFEPSIADEKFVPFFQKEGVDQLGAARRALWYFMGGGRGPNMVLLHGSSPSDKRKMLWWLMNRAPLEKIPFVQGHVRRSIQAEHHYRDALATFNPMQREIALLSQMIGAAWNGAMATQGEIATRQSRIAGRAAAITVAATASSSGINRDALGQFTSGQRIIAEVNRQVAMEFQDAVVNLMRSNRTGRPATEDLIKATADPRNRYPS